jgi:hypothetical protein
MAKQDPGQAIDFVSRIDADTLLVRTRLELGEMLGDAQRTVSRGDDDFDRYEKLLPSE